MKKSTLALVVFMASVIGGLYWVNRSFEALTVLDKDKVLAETRSAYEKIRFKKEPFSKKREIADFAEFLLRHVDEIKDHNRHDELRTIPLREGRWTGYENEGDCFGMPTFYRGFVEEYFPPDLVDSLYYYSDGIRNDLITGLTICGSKSKENISPLQGSVSFKLKYERRKPRGSYYVFHTLTLNKKMKGNNTLNSIYDYGLAKDTTFTHKMRYAILVSSYTGL